MKRFSQILLSAIGALALSGCHSAVFGDKPAGCGAGDVKTVRITTVIQGNYLPGDNSGLRAEEQGKVTEDSAEPFDPEVEAANEMETRVDRILVYVFKLGSSDTASPVKKLYLSPYPDNSLDGEGFENKTFEISTGDTPGKIRFDTELSPGTYEFYLLVNVPVPGSASGNANNLPYDKAGLKTYTLEEGSLFVYNGGDPASLQNIPMLGQQQIYVPANSTDNPYEADPEIKLERIYAKIDFRLTTATTDADGSLTFLNPVLDFVTKTEKGFLSVNDFSSRRCFFFPYDDEYTATGGLLTAGTAPDVSSIQGMTTVTYDYPGDFEDTETIEGLNKVLKGERMTTKTVFYLLPHFYANSVETDMPYLTFHTRTHSEDGTDPVTKVYRIPLYTVLSDNRKEFSIRRNTVYRIDAKLLGDELVLSMDLLHLVDDLEVRPPFDVPVFN